VEDEKTYLALMFATTGGGIRGINGAGHIFAGCTSTEHAREYVKQHPGSQCPD
jgi:hypothetical protein